MRRRIMRMLAWAVCLCCAMGLAQGASAQDAEPLTMQELETWRADIVQWLLDMPVLNDPPETLDPLNGDAYLIEYKGATVEARVPALTGAGGEVRTVTLDAMELPGPRGIGPGTSLADLLAAYPNENPTLIGDEDFAALYVYDAGEYPGLAEGVWAWVMRDGYRTLGLQYGVFSPHPQADAYVDAGVSYVIADGYVSVVRVYGLLSAIMEEEKQANMETLRDIAARTDFVPSAEEALGMRAEVFGREDLVFSDMDFLTMGVPEVRAAFGLPSTEEQVMGEATEAPAYLMGYPGLLFEFTLDQRGQPAVLKSVLIEDDGIPGPRGVRVGDELSQVLSLFRLEEQPWQNQQVILYAQAETLEVPPFGLLDYYAEQDGTLRYALPIAPGESDEAIMLHMSFEGLRITDILLYRWRIGE